jgi:hypothetical protein
MTLEAPGYNPYEPVDQNMFVLEGPDGAILLPEFWEQIISPGWTVTLRFIGKYDELNDLTCAKKNREADASPG